MRHNREFFKNLKPAPEIKDPAEVDTTGRDLDREIEYVRSGKEKRNFGC
jgi:hypothetical protein